MKISQGIFTGLLGVLFASGSPALAQDHGNGHGKGHDKHYEEVREDDRDDGERQERASGAHAGLAECLGEVHALKGCDGFPAVVPIVVVHPIRVVGHSLRLVLPLGLLRRIKGDRHSFVLVAANDAKLHEIGERPEDFPRLINRCEPVELVRLYPKK